MEGHIFRKVALERLSSPEQLDQMMRITNPKGWIALVSIGILLVCAVFWSIWGSIPDKVMGQGILVKSGGEFIISANGTGRVQDIFFSPGDTVQVGQVVALIFQEGIIAQIENARSKIEDLNEERDRIVQFGTEETGLEGQSIEQQRQTIQQNILKLTERVKWLNEKIENQKTVVEKGLITRQELINTQEELSAAQHNINEEQNNLKQLAIKEVQIANQQKRELAAADLKISEAERDLKQLQNELSEKAKVVSPYMGRILEISVDKGVMINQGSRMMGIELVGKQIKNLEAVLYFSPGEGKKIQLGMNARIAPSNVQIEKYGFMKGIVTYVAEFPSTSQGMMRVLQNEELVRGLSMGAAPIEVRADLIPDPRTPSGYKWSSSKGPSIKINSGTLCSATVTISEEPPYNLVVPLFKKHILGIGIE